MSQSAKQGDDLSRPSGAPDEGGVRELTPVRMWGKDTRRANDDDLYDFSPKMEEQTADEAEDTGDDSPDPKVSSAPASAIAAYYGRNRTPTRTVPEIDSTPVPETPASVDKVSTPPSPSESGTQTSQSKTSDGKNKQPAEASH